MTTDDPILSALDALGGDFELIACDPALADTAAFCEHYGYEPADSANTIIVIGKASPPVFAACVVRADTRLDVNGAVRKRLGTRKASFASAADTSAMTGMVVGGVTPVGLPPDLPLWIDAAIIERTRIVIGGGGRDRKIVCSPSLLTSLPSSEVIEGLARPG